MPHIGINRYSKSLFPEVLSHFCVQKSVAQVPKLSSKRNGNFSHHLKAKELDYVFLRLSGPVYGPVGFGMTMTDPEGVSIAPIFLGSEWERSTSWAYASDHRK